MRPERGGTRCYCSTHMGAPGRKTGNRAVELSGGSEKRRTLALALLTLEPALKNVAADAAVAANWQRERDFHADNQARRRQRVRAAADAGRRAVGLCRRVLRVRGGGSGGAVSGGAWDDEGARVQGTTQGARSIAPGGRDGRDDGEERARDVALVRPCA